MFKDPDSEAASGYDLFWLSESDQEQAELVRLLYVATTRAADYLILSSGLPEPRARRKAPGRNCFAGISTHRAGRYVLPSPSGRGAGIFT